MAMLKYSHFVSVGNVYLLLCQKLDSRSDTDRMDFVISSSLVAKKTELNITRLDTFTTSYRYNYCLQWKFSGRLLLLLRCIGRLVKLCEKTNQETDHQQYRNADCRCDGGRGLKVITDGKKNKVAQQQIEERIATNRQ